MPGVPSQDVFQLFGDALTYAKTVWMRLTFPFAGFGRGVSIHHSCEVGRHVSNRMRIGDRVFMGAYARLNVTDVAAGGPPVIRLDSGCKIGRGCLISAKNLVQLEEDVLLGPNVLITDHSHEFSDVEVPIHAQGINAGGTVILERNSWLGQGAVIVCTSGTLVVGRNCVVGANSVVTRSVPPFSVVAGNPAKVIKRFDPEAGKWVGVSDALTKAR
jgi:abequosyltransferase